MAATNRFFDNTNLSIVDGELAKAAQLNDVMNETNSAFELVQTELDTLSIGAGASYEWSNNDQGDAPDPINNPGEYSSKANAQEAAAWAAGVGGVSTEADGVTAIGRSSKEYSEDTAADAAQTAADRVATGNDLVATNQDTIDTAADLVQTNQDTLDTAADLVQTNQDTIDTAADRVQTGLDAQTAQGYADIAVDAAEDTAADLVLTNADVVLTGLDVDATNADVVQTGLDLVETNQDTLDTAADLVQTNQDTLDTAADLVQTNQDTLDTAADLVLTNADVVLTGLDVDATNADVVLTGLDVDATNADVVLTNADVVLTHADVVLTNADVVLTGLDVIQTGDDLTETNQDTLDTAADLVLTNADVVTTGDNVQKSEDWAEAAKGTGEPSTTNASSKNWAENAEDSEVITGSGKYSSLHHAAKAEDSATEAATIVNIGIYLSADMTGASTITIDASLADVFELINIDTNFTVTLSNMTAGRTITVWLNDGAGHVTWPAGIKWFEGTLPDLTADVDCLIFTQIGSSVIVGGYALGHSVP